jgi:V/A-type H+-transporting ATPase subunit I
MLRPAAMRRVLLLVPRADVDAVIDAVGSLGVLHLLDLSGREEWSWAVRPWDVGEAVRTCTETLRTIDALLRFYTPPPSPPPDPATLPKLDEVEPQVAAWAAEMEQLRGEREALRSLAASLEQARQSVAALAPAGVDLEALGAVRLLVPACGWMPASELPRLREVLSQVPHRVVVAGARGLQRLVIAFVLARDREVLARSLRNTGWVPVELPAELAASGDADTVLGERLALAREHLADVERRISTAGAALAEPLARARSAVERQRLLLQARSFTGRSEAVVFVAGWVPLEKVEALHRAVRRATRGRCHVAIEEPRSIDAVRSGSEPVPILFRNPALVRPFERLVAAYGTPRFGELDPTPIVAVAFWIMFGLMFGDVGHGLVLTATGLALFHRLPRYRDYAVILMECGLASAAFGLAYGSVFGLENVLPALWFRPMDDVPRLLRVGGAFGLLFLSLSFALGVVNALLRRDWRGAFAGQHGLLAALAYWTAAALGLRWLITGSTAVDTGLVVALLAVPLAALWGLRVLEELRRPAEEPGAAGGIVAAVLGGAVEIVDLVVRDVANTVSFVRLAAFALAHAGLLVAVFALERTVADAPGGTLWSALVIGVGNLLILALEGLIVSIQSVRLVYYEFFSRFHEGTGLEYRPLRLRGPAPDGEATT